MKHPYLTLASLSLSLAGVHAEDTSTVADPYRPTGRLDVSQAMVRQGVQPLLDWEIHYPKQVKDIVEINPDDSLTPKEKTLMEIRVAGASYQPSGTDAVVALQTRISSAGSQWQTLFQGTNSSVRPDEAIYQSVVPSGARIDFSSRGLLRPGVWTNSRNTLTDNQNVIVLRNGDPVPQYTPAFQQGDIESHVSSYVQNGRIVLGPRDLIYLVEIGQTSTTSSGFDMQDMVFVVTFKDVPTP